MMNAIVLLATIFAGGAVQAEAAPTYQAIMAEAEAAFAAEDWRTAADRLDAAQDLRPYSLFLTRNRILVRSMLGEYEAAEALAAKVADRGLAIRLTGHPGLEAFAERPAAAAIIARMDLNRSEKGKAEIALSHDDASLLPEAVAHDARTGAYFIGSVRSGKILRFANASAEGFAIAAGGVYALEASAGELWAAVNTAAPFESPDPSGARSSIVRYGLRDGAVKSAYPAPEGPATIGALESTRAGLVASDSATPRLLILRKGADALETLAADPRFVNLQGLAYDARRKRLYVADYLAGLFSVDLKTGAATPLANLADAHLGGLDGLQPYEGDLIGVQNGTTPQRIVRLRLNAAGDAVERLEVLQQALPGWNEPTNGTIVGARLVYIATSNWPAYGDDGAAPDAGALKPLTLMKLDLE